MLCDHLSLGLSVRYECASCQEDADFRRSTVVFCSADILRDLRRSSVQRVRFYTGVTRKINFGISNFSYKIYDVQTTTRSDLKFFQTVSRDLGLDILSSPKIGRKSSVIVSPSNDEIFRSFLSKQNVTHKLLQGDIQRLIDHERNSNDIHIRKRRTVQQNDTIPIVNFNGANFEYFWSLNDIYKYLNTLNEKYPNLVKVVDHGTTHENRSIKVITISTNGKVNGSRPIVLLDGGIHAREWASHMAVVYLIYQLVERSAENMDLLNNTDWVIMPVVNPDGYEYTQKDRLWRKNRSPNNNTVCFGTDLNRNFPIGWGNFGSVSFHFR